MDKEYKDIYKNWIDQKHPREIKELVSRRTKEIDEFLGSTFLDYYKNDMVDIIDAIEKKSEFPLIEEFWHLISAITKNIKDERKMNPKDLDYYENINKNYENHLTHINSKNNIIKNHHDLIQISITHVNTMLSDCEEYDINRFSNYINKYQDIEKSNKIMDINYAIKEQIQFMIHYKGSKEEIKMEIDNFKKEITKFKLKYDSYLEPLKVVVNNWNQVIALYNKYSYSLLDLIFKLKQAEEFLKLELEEIKSAGKSKLFKLTNPNIRNNEELNKQNIKNTLIWRYKLESSFRDFISLKHMGDIPDDMLKDLPPNFRCRSLDLLIDLIYFIIGSILAILYVSSQIGEYKDLEDSLLGIGGVILIFGIIGKICEYVNKYSSYRPGLFYIKKDPPKCSNCWYNIHLLCSVTTNIETYHNSDKFNDVNDIKKYNESCVGGCINGIV